MEKIIEMKDAKFININDIKITNEGNVSCKRLFFFKNKPTITITYCNINQQFCKKYFIINNKIIYNYNYVFLLNILKISLSTLLLTLFLSSLISLINLF